MKLRIIFTALITFGFMVVSAQHSKPISGQYIVILKETAVSPPIRQVKQTNNRLQNAEGYNRQSLQVFDKIKDIRREVGIKTFTDGSDAEDKSAFAYVTCGFSAILTSEQVANLKAHPEVQGVYQDYELKLTPATYGIDPSDIQINKQLTPCSVTMAGGQFDGSKKNTWIWFIDSGIDGSHPDLNVQTDPMFAISFIPGESWNDNSGHSTHCAGIAAAKNNNFGIVGVSSGAMVVPVKVFNTAGIATWSSIVAALNHIARYAIPGDVICIPFGGREGPTCTNCNTAVRAAITNLSNTGKWVVMTAGNDAGDALGFCPGCTNGARICTVGSISCTRTASSFSNFNPEVVNWIAVGEDVYSTLPRGKYGTRSGAEMAASVVAGIIHARGGAPVSSGTVTCNGHNYSIAHR